jgi:hypothetical protein
MNEISPSSVRVRHSFYCKKITGSLTQLILIKRHLIIIMAKGFSDVDDQTYGYYHFYIFRSVYTVDLVNNVILRAIFLAKDSLLGKKLSRILFLILTLGSMPPSPSTAFERFNNLLS